MGRSILIDGLSRPIRLADFELVEAARNGEVGMGGIDVDSENAAFDFNSHKSFSVMDTSAGSNIFTGYIADKDVHRGPFSVVNDRQFDTNIVDLNTKLIDDIITGSSGNRPEETDIARVTWLVGTSFLDGMGATIGASGATTLEAADYRTQTPLQLLTQAAETSGKLFFVYWDLATQAPKLFYDLATASNFITSHKISTYLPDGSNSTTHHPRKDSLSRKLDGGRIYSEVLFKYDGGSVTVTNAATASNYRARKTVVYDNSVKTSAMATRKANQYLNTASTEEEVITVEVDVAAADALAFRAGQLMQIKAPHLGLPNFTDRRIVRTSKKPRTDTDEEGYRIAMELSIPKANQWGSRGVPTDVLPDSVANIPPTAPASTTTGTCIALAGPYTAINDTEDGGLRSSGIPSKVQSGIYYNVPYTNGDGCSAPYGGWKYYADTELWYEFFAPADSASYLGMQFDIGPMTQVGYDGGLLLAISRKGARPSASNYMQWNLVGEVDWRVGKTYYIPRNFINWNDNCSIVFAPGWRCDRPGVFVCYNNPNGPGSGSVANSGNYDGWGAFISNICTFGYTSGQTGMSDWKAGYGPTDGVNQLYRLISWNGNGIPEVMLNGIILPSEAVTFDGAATTARLGFAPPEGSTLLFNYQVET